MHHASPQGIERLKSHDHKRHDEWKHDTDGFSQDLRQELC